MKYQKQQRNLLGLVDAKIDGKNSLFYCFDKRRKWSVHTQTSRFETILSIMKILRQNPTPEDLLFKTSLERESKTKFPTKITIPMESSHFLQITSYLLEKHENNAAAYLTIAFLLGQRIPDVFLLGDDSFAIPIQSIDGINQIPLTFLRGKTIGRHIPPFTLHFKLNTKYGELVLNLRKDILRHGQGTEKNTKMYKKAIRHAIKKCGFSISLRSIRKGGLVRMAKLGMSVENIQHYSQHRKRENLMRYLDWGASNFELVRMSEQINLCEP